MQTITPFLWFDDQAEEAADLYVSVFAGRGSGESKVLEVARYGPAAAEAGGRPEGSVLTVRFLLGGQEFVALNGGPAFPFTEAVSLMVPCDGQEEVDWFWSRLSDGGEEGPCGWLKDRYGLSWQIVPTAFLDMARDEDPVRVERVMAAMLSMGKMDVAELQRAYRGE